MTELKPCPFCGKEVNIEWFDSEHQNTKILDQDEPNEPKYLYIACHECDYELSFDTVFGTARELREAWNRRVNNEQSCADKHTP